MPNISYSQTSFTAGQVGEEYTGNLESDEYNPGLEKLSTAISLRLVH